MATIDLPDPAVDLATGTALYVRSGSDEMFRAAGVFVRLRSSTAPWQDELPPATVLVPDRRLLFFSTWVSVLPAGTYVGFDPDIRTPLETETIEEVVRDVGAIPTVGLGIDAPWDQHERWNLTDRFGFPAALKGPPFSFAAADRCTVSQPCRRAGHAAHGASCPRAGCNCP
jgi:hypothetical protein